MSEYTPVIGMEIHVELKTASKMFCGCKNDPFFAKEPNSYTCPVCLGMPGGLPVPNRKAVEWTIMLGLALGCEIPLLSKFDRKNYFYPDLPKGYQISQYDQPLCVHGSLETEFGRVGIRRVHLEEDTGKLLHTTIQGKKVTLVDFNRSGVPLVEIVTEPDIASGEHAKVFLKKLHQIIRYLNISDADMEKGSMRLEPNISVRKPGETGLPEYKVEVKNINSFNFVKRAIEYEIERHREILGQGSTPTQETRGWNETKGTTFSQRRKEEADDYRYFPEPDIPPLRWNKEFIDAMRSLLPETPDSRHTRFMSEFGLADTEAALLTEDRNIADYFEESVKVSQTGAIAQEGLTPKKIANWVVNKKSEIENLLPAQLVSHIIQATHTVVVSEDELTAAITEVLEKQPKAAADYKAGKEQALMFLLGQTLRILKGNQDKQKILELLRKKLNA